MTQISPLTGSAYNMFKMPPDQKTIRAIRRPKQFLKKDANKEVRQTPPGKKSSKKALVGGWVAVAGIIAVVAYGVRQGR